MGEEWDGGVGGGGGGGGGEAVKVGVTGIARWKLEPLPQGKGERSGTVGCG